MTTYANTVPNALSTPIADGNNKIAAGWLPVAMTQAAGGPNTLAANAEVTVTHPLVTNERVMFSVMRDAAQNGLTNMSLDFDLADESQFTYDNTKLAFGADGMIRLLNNGTIETDTCVPDMTNYTTSGVTIDRSRVYAEGTYAGWKAFNSNTADYDHWLTPAPAPTIGSPDWLSVDFGVGNANQIYRYDLTANVSGWGGAPRDWTFQGSSDGASWTILDTRTSEGFTTAQTRTFTVAAPGTYRFYRIHVTDINAGSSYGVAIIKLALMKQTLDFVSGGPYVVATKDTNHIDLSNTGLINSATISSDAPVGTTLTGLVSFDGRVTWKKWSGSVWNVHAGGTGDIANGNTIAQIISGLTSYVPNPNETLDFAFGLKATDATKTPFVDQITINFNEATYYGLASVGDIGSGANFGVRRLSPTTTKFKNQMGSTQTVFVNVLTF